MKLLRYLPAPALVVGAGLFLFCILARLDGAQTARLNELDRQQATLTAQTLHAFQTRRAVQAQSEATDRENARLKRLVAAGQALTAQLQRRGDSLAGTIRPILASLPDSVSHPIVMLLALKDSIIGAQAQVIHAQGQAINNLLIDRNQWRAQDGRDAQLAAQWQRQAGQWRKESRRGCLPLLGCISRSAVALVAGGLGVAGGVLLGR